MQLIEISFQIIERIKLLMCFKDSKKKTLKKGELQFTPTIRL